MDDAKKAEAIAIAATKKLKDLKYKDALDLFNQAIKASKTFCGNNPYFYSRRGECFMKLGFFDEAIQDISKACELDARPDLKHELCSAYFYSGQYERAIDSIDCLILEISEDETYLAGYCFLLMAAAYHKLEDRDNMYTCLEKAAERDIDDISVLTYGEMYDDISEEDRFVAIFDP